MLILPKIEDKFSHEIKGIFKAEKNSGTPHRLFGKITHCGESKVTKLNNSTKNSALCQNVMPLEAAHKAKEKTPLTTCVSYSEQK